MLNISFSILTWGEWLEFFFPVCFHADSGIQNTNKRMRMKKKRKKNIERCWWRWWKKDKKWKRKERIPSYRFLHFMVCVKKFLFPCYCIIYLLEIAKYTPTCLYCEIYLFLSSYSWYEYSKWKLNRQIMKKNLLSSSSSSSGNDNHTSCSLVDIDIMWS